MQNDMAEDIISVVRYVLDSNPANFNEIKQYRIDALSHVAQQEPVVNAATVRDACTRRIGWVRRGAIRKFDHELWNAAQGNYESLRDRCIKHASGVEQREKLRNFFDDYFGIPSSYTPDDPIVGTDCEDGPGWVYVVVNRKSWSNWVKIGCTMNPEIRESSFQTYSPYDYDMCHKKHSKIHCYGDEKKVHRYLVEILDIEKKREWFKTSIENAIRVIEKILD